MFIPLKDENPTVNKPYITFALILVNCLVFFYSYLQSSRGFQVFLFKYGLIPHELIHLTELTPEISVPILLTPFTSMFLHGGIIHLAGNMLFLWIFGDNVEDHLGPIKFLIFYLASGLSAVFLYTIFSPNSQVPLVGASGAIAGVLGAYLVLFPRARVLTLIFLFYFIRIVRLPAKFMLGFWFFYQLFMSVVGSGGGGGVAWLAHVGGFGFGYLWFRIFVHKRQPRIEFRI